MANEEQLALLKQGVDVWNQWRIHNPQVPIDLGNADLRRAELRDANLSGSDLSRAKFAGAYLWNANLRGTNLTGTHLSGDLMGADLTGAVFYDTQVYGAFLAGAHLNDTRLVRTIFLNTSLERTDFTGAVCGGVIFANTDLSGAEGLETVRHLAPSTIGTDTLFLSVPKLPDDFLRGCGVPQALVERLPHMLNVANEYYSCFISYSGADEQFATMLYNLLIARGINCWKASEQFLPGDRLTAEIDRGITGWDKLLLCCSRSSLTQRWWVNFEVEKAFAKERKLQDERGRQVDVIIPLNLDGYLLSKEYEEREDPRRSELLARFAPKITGWEHDNAIFEREIEGVIKALRTDGGKEPPPTPKL